MAGERKGVDFSHWATLIGSWDLDSGVAKYLGPSHGSDINTGLVLSSGVLSSGCIRTTVNFPHSDEEQPQGRIVFGRDPETNAHYSAGIGGYERGYVIEEFVPGRGFLPLRTEGDAQNVRREHDHELMIFALGQTVILEIDGVEVMQAELPHPLFGEGVGLTAWGIGPVYFSSFDVEAQAPQAFVVMQFGEPFDSIYQEVIRPVCEAAGYSPMRADEMQAPGMILQDIIQGIREATVVVAEITPANPNVFYELGYAHATGKPTILLAERDQPLPFDVSGYRCIFYDDTIGGKVAVEEQLQRHLNSI